MIPVWWFAVRKYRVGWDRIGLRGFSIGMLGLVGRLLLLSFAFNFVYSLLLMSFDHRAQPDLAPVLAEMASPGWFLLAGAVVAPIVEEIFFRGFVFAGLRVAYGWKGAALLSSTLFAVIHFQPLAILPLVLLGYFFAYLYQRSGSIWPAILMHMTINSVTLGVAYMTAQHAPTG